jgi:hypothetical protein
LRNLKAVFANTLAMIFDRCDLYPSCSYLHATP